MKTFVWILLPFLCLLVSTSCENRSVNQRAGTYIGEAKINSTERVVSAGATTERVIFEGTVSDTFTVEVIDIEEKKYEVARSTWLNGPGGRSLYDIGNPYGEYIFDEDFYWGYGYTYDKNWDSRLDLSDRGELVGYMVENDVFGSEGIDNQGNMIEVFNTFEYSIVATKLK